MTTAIDPGQQTHVDQLEAEVRQIMQQTEDLYAEFVILQRNFLHHIDKLKARRDVILHEIYQLTGDATIPSPGESIEKAETS
jgi:hypothetical protein